MSVIRPVFQPATLAGRKQFEVPWENANEIRHQLTECGISATAVLTTEEKKAVIEVDNDVQADLIMAALV